MNKILGSGVLGGLIANIGANLNLINEIVGILAGAVSIVCAFVIIYWKYKDRKNDRNRIK